MAIAGSGGWIPSTRVCVRGRELVRDKPDCNVHPSVVWRPEDAAAYFLDKPNAYIYVPISDFGGVFYLEDLLVELDVVDPIDMPMVWKYA